MFVPPSLHEGRISAADRFGYVESWDIQKWSCTVAVDVRPIERIPARLARFGTPVPEGAAAYPHQVAAFENLLLICCREEKGDEWAARYLIAANRVKSVCALF